MSTADPASSVVLKGTGRGLEILVDEATPFPQVIVELEARLAHSPGFFSGNDTRLALGARVLPPGGLTQLKAVFDRYGVRIAELRSERAEITQAAANLQIAVPAPAPAREPQAGSAKGAEGEATQLVHGPVRSGSAQRAGGHLVIVGDVNPGAEVHAGGNICVLGALRGLAHAASGRDSGYIIALRLEAQQLRIGPLIARAGEAPDAATGPEIAYVSGARIVVEPYQGRLPPGALREAQGGLQNDGAQERRHSDARTENA
jgi:septum site-determining protein MinC